MKRNKSLTAALLSLLSITVLCQTQITPSAAPSTQAPTTTAPSSIMYNSWVRLPGFNFNPMSLVYPSVSTWANYTTATIDACEDICDQGPGCDFYTFNSVSNVCDLKF
eukprot:gene35068-45393_t